MKVSIVIVSYNVREFLEQALRSLEQSLQQIEHEIIVVDNASSDSTVTMLKRRFQTVKLIENTHNVGFARANNQAILHASGEFICLINPDTIVQENTFSILFEFFEQYPKAGMASCKVLNADGSLQLACRRSYPTPWVAFTKIIGLATLFPKSRLFGRYNLTFLDPEKISQVEAISGSFMLVRKSVIEIVGGLDEDFFMYGEDLDWCYRIQKAGHKIYYVPDTQIIHFKGESSKKSPLQQRRLFYEAMRLFVQKHFRKGSAVLPTWFLVLAIYASASLSYLSQVVRRLIWPILDFVLLTCSLALAIYVRFKPDFPWQPFLLVYVIYTTTWLFSLTAHGVYTHNRLSGSKAASGVLVGLLINSAFTFFFNQIAFSRAVVLLAGSFSLVFVPVWRVLMKWLARKGYGRLSTRLKGLLLRRRSLIVGDRATNEKIIQKMKKQVDGTYLIEGVVLINEQERHEDVNGIPVMGFIDHLPEIIKRERVQEVIFSTDKLPYDKMLSAVANSLGSQISFKMVPSDLDVVIGKATIDYIDDIPFVDLDYRLHNGFYKNIKRMFDFSLASLVMIITAPVYFILRLTKRFEIRSIQTPLSKRKVTVIKFFQCRKSRWWCYLPAIPAIIRGDLSFVGRDIYNIAEFDNNQISLSLKPGLAGLEQANRHIELSQEDRYRYHLFYLKNYSPFVDIEIILKTILRRR